MIDKNLNKLEKLFIEEAKIDFLIPYLLFKMKKIVFMTTMRVLCNRAGGFYGGL